jgi:hypothetical protein
MFKIYFWKIKRFPKKANLLSPFLCGVRRLVFLFPEMGKGKQ